MVSAAFGGGGLSLASFVPRSHDGVARGRLAIVESKPVYYTHTYGSLEESEFADTDTGGNTDLPASQALVYGKYLFEHAQMFSPSGFLWPGHVELTFGPGH